METILLGLALALDAAVVSFALGLLARELSLKERVLRGAAVVLCFGSFQFFMLWLGSQGGFYFSFSRFGHLFPLVVASVFFFMALKAFLEAISEESRELSHQALSILVLGIATSIDALASGLGLGTLPQTHWIALEIGLITALLCTAFYSLAQFLKKIPERWLLVLAGLIFLGLGSNVLFTQVFKGVL